MAPAVDVVSDSAGTFTDDTSWSHAAAASGVIGVCVGIVAIPGGGSGLADQIKGVTYGGSAMSEATGSPNVTDTGTEDFVVHKFYLTSSVPQGTQTVAIDASATTMTKCAWAMTVTGTGTGEVDAVLTTQASTGEMTGTLATTASTATAIGMVMAAGPDVTGWTAGSGWTLDNAEVDFGGQTAAFQSRTAAGGNVTTDSNYPGPGTEEWKLFALAIREAAASNITWTVPAPIGF